VANKKLVLETPKGQMFTSKTKNGTIKVSIKWADGFGPKATANLQSVQTEFSNECLRLCDKYTPKDTGILVASALLSSKPEDGLLVWNTPYAGQQYYSKRSPGSQTGTLRGPYWGERMKADNLAQLSSFVKRRVDI